MYSNANTKIHIHSKVFKNIVYCNAACVIFFSRSGSSHGITTMHYSKKHFSCNANISPYLNQALTYIIHALHYSVCLWIHIVSKLLCVSFI